MRSDKIYIMSCGASGEWTADGALPAFGLDDMREAISVAASMATLRPEYKWRASTGDARPYESAEDAGVILRSRGIHA